MKINQMTVAQIKATLMKAASNGDTNSVHVRRLRDRLKQLQKGLAIALLVLTLLASLFTPASAHPSCQLQRIRNGNVMVVRGPCYRHDFPASCKVPAKIEQGQTVQCR